MLDIIRNFYQKESVSYDNTVQSYWSFDRSQITDILKNSKNIVEFGVGTGLNIPFYPNHANVTAIDLSEKMFEVAKLKVTPNQNVQFIRGDVSSQKFPEDFFDGAIATYYFSVTPNLDKDIKTLKQIIRVGSPIVIVDMSKGNSNLMYRIFGSLLYRILYFNPYRDLKNIFLKHGFKINKKVCLGKFGRKLKFDTYLLSLSK